MGHIPINFNEVPIEIPPVPPGIYDAVVEEVNIEPTRDGASEKLVVRMKITSEGESTGRMLFDHLGLKFPTPIKRLALSAGVQVGEDGLDTSELVGKIVRCRVKSRTYQDKDSGEVREVTQVAEYLIDQ